MAYLPIAICLIDILFLTFCDIYPVMFDPFAIQL
jgi:hypothetical protein